MRISIGHIKWMGICLGIVIVLLSALVFLDAYRDIRKIGVGSVWHLPSRIYSSALTIRPGLDVDHIGLQGRLDRLRYRRVSEVTEPGEYMSDPEGITIFLHAFDYPGERTKASLFRLLIMDKKITGITRIDTAQHVDAVVLEPECITEIFDERFEDRTLITLDECPGYLIDALIVTEDRRFYQHSGIDVRSLVRAALANFHKGEIVEGGSTITQQLIKNLFLTKKRTFTRKFKEMWMSFIMEWVYSKQEILGMYINEIYMGRRGYTGIYGFGRAARLFFDKDVSEISIPEAALLAGIIRAPNRYSPYMFPARALARRNTVLELMRDEGKISQQVYEETKCTPLEVVPFEPKIRQAPYFIDHVLSLIQDEYPVSQLSKGGYRIFTTLDMHMQITARELLQHGLKSRDAALDGAVVMSDPATGDILAMVGGKSYTSSQFNRATQIKRHIGSLIKPLIYYCALRRGYTLSTFVDDGPVSVKLPDSRMWKPENFDGKSHGRVMIKDALVNSYNHATVRVGMDVGIPAVVSEIRNVLPGVGVNENPSVLLGALDCSPLEVTTLYSTFANGGYGVQPRCIDAIVNENGTILWQAPTHGGQRVFDAGVVYLLDDALMDVVTSGTARASSMYGMPSGVCGKTGTTNDMRDSWFVGFTHDVVVSVWLGNDEFRPIGLSGSSGAMPIASMILARITGRDVWTAPQDIIFCSIDPADGKLAGMWSRQKIKLPYIQGTQPTDVSDTGVPRILKFFRSILKD